MTLSFNLAPNVSLGQATEAINNAQRAINFPPTIDASFQGTAAAFQSSLASEPFLILAALVTVYLVLGMLYESYIHPITILSTLPSAGVGAILALLLTHSELNVMGLIGIILLIGIVKKNAIMMIDFALETERAGKSSGRIDLRSVRSPLPPHHDDHHGRAAGRIAAGPGHRHGIGAEASAGHHDCRRTDHEPGAHALHHAGRISLSRSLPPDARKQASHRSQPARAALSAAQRRRLMRMST